MADPLPTNISKFGTAQPDAVASIVNEYAYFVVPTFDEYLVSHGGKWFYSHGLPGTPWFDKADNEKGWTVDFQLKVFRVQNSYGFSSAEPPDGIGVYVNDGKRMESIYFFEQEIAFANACVSAVYDTTSVIDYRLTGQGDCISLYGRRENENIYRLIKETLLKTPSTNEANASSPAVYEDDNGDLHVVWWDDGNGQGQIYYNKFSSGAWGSPELVVPAEFGALNPDITVNTEGAIYIVYETKDTDQTSIGFIYKNDIGWSEPQFIGIGVGISSNPKVVLDGSERAHVVWDDARHGYPEIFHVQWNPETLSLGEERRLTNTKFGAFRPSCCAYQNDLFIAYVNRTSVDRQKIRVTSLNPVTGEQPGGADVAGDSEAHDQSDYPDIVLDHSGKIFIAWHDRLAGNSFTDIYARILNPVFDPVTSITRLSSSSANSLYPVLSLQKSTNDIYLAYEESRTLTAEVDPYLDPYLDPYKIESRHCVKIAFFDSSQNAWQSGTTGEMDTILVATDGREWFSPALPKSFAGELDVIYKSQMATLVDEYIPTSEIFSQIRHAIYDLSGVEEFIILEDEYTFRDFLVSANLMLRKEIRFGDFSDTLSAKFRFQSIRYYLEDAVVPFETSFITDDLYPIDNLVVQDAVVNNYGDAWLGSNCGLTFYFNKDGNITQSIPGIEKDNIRAVEFDLNNTMFIGTDSKLVYSLDHMTFSTLTGIDSLNDITSLAFDANNRVLIGTQFDGVYIAEVNDDGTLTEERQIKDDLPSAFVTAVKVDASNAAWIATTRGLARFRNGLLSIFTTTHGLPSNRINDIAIRNVAIRYLATSGGLVKMVGTAFDRISSDTGALWNNNVKSVAWQEPNVLWAGTMSAVNQIVVNDDLEGGLPVVFKPEHYSTSSEMLDDHQTFFIVADESESIPEDATVEVFLNGNRIFHGFDVSVRNKKFRTLRFKTPLIHDDVIDVIVRNDVLQLASFAQTDAEKAKLGVKVVKVKSLEVIGSEIYAAVEGKQNEIKISDRVTSVPFDRVHLDQTPPIGCIKIDEQIDRTTIRVTIEDVDDGTSGSGVDRMVISNFSNFTTDGSTEQATIPFSTSAIHDLGLGLDTVTNQLELDSGTGSVVEYFLDQNQLFAATSKPAQVYRQNIETEEWTVVKAFNSDQHIDFMVNYNGLFVVGVGHDSSPAKVFTFPETATATGYDFNDATSYVLSSSRALSAHEFNNVLYVGDNSGKVYRFDGNTLAVMFSGLDSNVYGLTSAAGSLYASTGNNGRIYQMSVEDGVAPIIHSDSDTSVLSIAGFTFEGNPLLFAGTSSEGKIIRSKTSSIGFNTSFQTTAAAAPAVKTFGTSELLAAVGRMVYRFSENGTWIWRYTHDEDIVDIALNTGTDALYIASASKVTKIDPQEQSKKIYLKLIDRAGNESVIFDNAGDLIDCTFAEISITDLQEFVNQFRIVELDSVGNVVSTINGDNFFYSADRIDCEIGIYESEIFNGTNDLIKWDRISWKATEPTNTTVEMFVRASATKTDILLQDYVGPFTTEQANGVNLDFLTGQFVQFKAVLTSKSKGVSPTLHSALIRSVTSEAIHFFTTNFVLPSRITKGILTSQKMLPVASDIVFGINTTNSVDWSDYQVIDTERLFNINQFGDNLRVGIRLISPGRSQLTADQFDEYGPYGAPLFINTIDFDYKNNGPTDIFHFRVSLYDDVGLTSQVFEAFTATSASGFSAEGEDFPSGGRTILSGETTNFLFTVPTSANLKCQTNYFVKIEVYDGTSYSTISDNFAFIMGCSASFVDVIDFDFTNNTGSKKDYHFRIKFFEDGERTDLFLTELSANDRSGWTANSEAIPEDGVEVVPGEAVSIVFEPDLDKLEPNTLYYLTIDTFDGSEFALASNFYTFQARDVDSAIYCGPYFDVPVVKDFGLIFETENNDFLTLNLS